MVSWAEIPLAPITESKRIKMDFFIDESSLTVYKATLRKFCLDKDSSGGEE